MQKDHKNKKPELKSLHDENDSSWWSNCGIPDTWEEPEPVAPFEEEAAIFEMPLGARISTGTADPLQHIDINRIERIKESYTLLCQFSPIELKILLNLKRNTSPKAWSLREDLVVLTFPAGNRELADKLHDRNKEAVKKRLQLLRSKGLSKRISDMPDSDVPATPAG